MRQYPSLLVMVVVVGVCLIERSWGCFDGRVFTHKRCCEQKDPACWTDPQYTFGSCCCFQGGFTETHCCHSFDAACWDPRFTFDACCARPADLQGVENSERWQRYMARADGAITGLQDVDAPANYQKLWRATQDILAAVDLVRACNKDHRKFATESALRLLRLAGKFSRISLAKTIDFSKISDRVSDPPRVAASLPHTLEPAGEELRS